MTTVTMDLGPEGEWTAEMTWHDGTQGGPDVLTIRPTNHGSRPAGGISQTVLRDINFKTALDVLRLHSTPQAGRETADERLAALAGGALTDEYLAALACAYVLAVADGQAKPVEHLAKVAGGSVAAVRGQLWQATRKGLLERSAGRAGGRLTAKAEELLLSL